MNRTLDLARFSLLALGVAFVAPSCDEDAAPAAPQQAAPPVQVAAPQPTAESALARSRAYWAAVQKGDWLPTFDMLTPESQAEQPLAAYLQAKNNHKYENVNVEEVVAQTTDRIFVRISGLWTPMHPAAKRVKLEPGQTMTTPFVMIEVWRWERGQWLSERRLRPEEFLEEFPDVNTKAPAPAAPADAK
jgi:hypothetical protein